MRFPLIVRSLVIACVLSSALHASAVAQKVIKPIEELRIDAGENDLAPIWHLYVSPKGVMVASQQADRHFRFFSPNGKPLGTFGRKGDGPGEFQRVEGTRAGWMGDTLWLTEAQKPRLTIVGPDLKFVRVEPVLLELTGPNGEVIKDASINWVYVMGVAPDRSLQTSGFLRTGSSAPPWLPLPANSGTFVLRENRDGHFLRLLAATPQESAACRFGEAPSQVAVPFCPHESRTEPLDRNRIIVAIPGAGSGTEGRFRLVALHGTTGDTLLNREYSYRATPIPATLVDSLRQKIVDDKQYPPPYRALYAKVPFSKYFPPFRSVLNGRDGTIALEIYTATGTKAWRLFNARGDDIGTVAFPPSVRIFQIEKGRAWGTDGEEGDQDSIVRYRFP